MTVFFFFFKQKTAYEMRISDWSSDVCSSDLVIVEGGDIYGDGVNVAARIEVLADPGGICIARNVFNQVKGKLQLDFEHLGEREVKNISEPVSVYRVVLDDKAERLVTSVQARTSPRRLRPALAAGVVVLLAAIAGRSE